MFNLFRSAKESKRKQKLGEKYSSSITDRRFQTESFVKLNPKVDLEAIEYIYSLGFFKRTDFWIFVIEECLKARLFNLMSSIVFDVSRTKDEMGCLPIGDYVKIHIWKTKKNEYHAQLEGGTFHLPLHPPKEKSKCHVVSTIEIKSFNPKLIKNRELVYPI
jgi:hypothetical protein